MTEALTSRFLELRVLKLLLLLTLLLQLMAVVLRVRLVQHQCRTL